MLFLDVETRSRRSVVECGVHELAKDPELRLLCVSYALGDEPVATWNCAFSDGDPDLADPIPDDLAAALGDPDETILVWNEAFERTVLNALRRRYQLPFLTVERFICVMTLARAHNLPGALDTCSRAWLPPELAKIDGKPTGWMWSTSHALLPEHEDAYRNGQVVYCEQDVVAMRELYRLMVDPDPRMLEQYNAAARINDRGVRMDRAMIDAAITLAPVVDAEIRKELNEVTGGMVKPRGPSFLKWLQLVLPPVLLPLLRATKRTRSGYGWSSTTRPSTDRSVRARLLEALDEFAGMLDVREALDLFDEANRAAVTKYKAAAARTSVGEDVLRGQYLFNGAAQTGRYSAVGMQVHNLIRAVPKNAMEIRAALLTAAVDHIREATGMSVNKALSRVLRTVFIARLRKRLVWGDWSSIEARLLPWLSGDADAEPVLEVFRGGGDLYRVEAAGIFGKPVEEIDDEERQVGKVAVLALGYNGGVGAFQSLARNYGVSIPDAMASMVVKAWRANNPWARRFWQALDLAAKNAILYPGMLFEAGRIQMVFMPTLLRGTLVVFLPSGRPLMYPEARLVTVEKFDQHVDAVVFRHPVYGFVDTYGGKLAENVTQAAAADLLREALVLTQRETVLHTHDEIINEVPEEAVEDGCRRLYAAMTTVPEWASGLPLACEIYHGERYKVGTKWAPEVIEGPPAVTPSTAKQKETSS